MKKKNKNIFSRTGYLILLLVVCVAGCSKTTETVTTVPDPPPINTSPSGEIQTFVITDSLVPYNTGSTAKWLVTGTNSYSIVTFNGVKVATYGILDTGPLKQDTKFTLAVNNGKQSSIIVRVGDSVSTYLWNEGRGMRLVKLEAFVVPSGRTDPEWVDSTSAITERQADQRLFFTLFGESKILQSKTNFVSPGDAGRYVVNAMQNGFTWQGITYTITTINGQVLVVTYSALQPNNTYILMRNTYKFL